VGEFNGARTRPAARAIALAALAVGLLTVPSASTVGPPAPAPDLHPGWIASTSEAVPTVGLSIGGTEYPPEGSTDSNLDGLWGPVPSTCQLFPEWYSWFLPAPSSARGTFLTPALPDTSFAPATLAAGPAEVGLRATADVACGGANRTVEALAFANVSANPPPAIVNLSASPAATTAPASVNLSGVILGGRAPYLLGVAWGDGSFSNESLPVAGPFLLSHPYGPGTFAPRVAVRDAERLDVRVHLAIPIEVTNSTALTILASQPLAEVGQPVGFRGVVERPPTNLGIDLGCGPSVRVPVGANITNLTCTPVAPGTLDATLEVLAPYPDGDQEVTRVQPVAPAVALTLRAMDPSVDVGTPAYLVVQLTGGVPPFHVTCSAGGDVLLNLSNASSDGSFLVPWRPLVAGAVLLAGTITDALGAVGTAPWARAIVSPTPRLTLGANESVSTRSTRVIVQGGLQGGAGPVRWSLTSSLSPFNGTVPYGENATGGLAWTAYFAEEGLTNLTVGVLDAALTYLTASLPVGLPPAPVLSSLHLEATPMPGAPAVLWVNWTGGVPPYELWVNSTAGMEWNGSAPTAGTVSIPLPNEPAGNVTLSVAVADARGYGASGNLTEFFAARPASGTIRVAESNPVPWAIGALLGAIALAFAVGRRWRRERAPSVPAPDAARVLEELLRPAEGADRLTIEMMAEEEGVPLETVQSTIDRLVREGRIRSESEPGGGEVLAWETLSDP
jgi:hypothetical protein